MASQLKSELQKAAPDSAGHTTRGLTHPLDLTKEGLAMDATQDQSIAAIVSRKARRPKMPIIIPPRVAERAATRCYVDANGCHISTYSTASHG